MAPTNGPAWKTDLENGADFDGLHRLLDAGGGVGLPERDRAGRVRARHLPLGVSFFAGRWSEPTLVSVAFAFEQATKARRAPYLPGTLSPRTGSRTRAATS